MTYRPTHSVDHTQDTTVISYTQSYAVIQNTITKQLWNGHQWITPENRLEVYVCSLDPDDTQNGYAESSVHTLCSPNTYELKTITVETRINL